ncbi:30S ribosomal protein S21 [Microgenomates group bacterium RBG_19FT_COMBO_39_10]|nr:MAG: 30S ribosomal protein S21 [Microgenomates group bacterium RBG_19FT_COMBO_39_10]
MATVVRKKPGESDDKLIAKFRKKVQAEQLLTEIKELEYYEKPSVKKKKQKAELRRRRVKRY